MMNETNRPLGTSDDRERFWKQHLDAWHASGMKQAAYCRLHELKWFQFHYWKKRLASDPPKGRLRLVPLAVGRPHALASNSRSSGVRVRVGRVSVEVDSGFDAATLKAVIETLERGSCGG